MPKEEASLSFAASVPDSISFNPYIPAIFIAPGCLSATALFLLFTNCSRNPLRKGSCGEAGYDAGYVPKPKTLHGSRTTIAPG